MRVAVTGGAGFIGTNVVDRLLGAGASVVVIDDFSTGFRDNLEGSSAQIAEGTILDQGLLLRSLQGVDSVIHLAARPSVPRSLADPLASHDANATGTLRVLEAARQAGVGHVVVASSSSVYGANVELPKRESMMTAPVSPYAVSKLAAESYALSYSRCFGLPVLALRFFNVYGPYQRAGHAYAAVIPAFVDAALRGDPVIIHGDGEQSRDFTHVDSVAAILTTAVEDRRSADGPVNLAFGSRATLLDVVIELEQMLGEPVTRRHIATREGDVRHSQAANERLRALFPEARAVDLADGLRNTVDWYRHYARTGVPVMIPSL
jgi:UDP-glucose 4-epimerase